MKKKIWEFLCGGVKVILLIAIFAIAWNIAYYNFTPNDEEIKQRYVEREEKCNMLREIAQEVIIEGEGIAYAKIPTDKIKFNISNSDDNIIFNYYFKPEKHQSNNNNPYKAKITLTKDCNIFAEEYGVESMKFTEYYDAYVKNNRAFAVVVGFMALMVAYMVYKLFYNVIIKPLKRKKYRG